jgi:hypothetical protein
VDCTPGASDENWFGFDRFNRREHTPGPMTWRPMKVPSKTWREAARVYENVNPSSPAFEAMRRLCDHVAAAPYTRTPPSRKRPPNLGTSTIGG